MMTLSTPGQRQLQFRDRATRRTQGWRDLEPGIRAVTFLHAMQHGSSDGVALGLVTVGPSDFSYMDTSRSIWRNRTLLDLVWCWFAGPPVREPQSRRLRRLASTTWTPSRSVSMPRWRNGTWIIFAHARYCVSFATPIFTYLKLSMAKLRSPLVARKKSPSLGLIRSCSGWFLLWLWPGAYGRNRRWLRPHWRGAGAGPAG
jgi:hypothetical protein